MKAKFYDARHKEICEEIIEKYHVNTRNRDYFLLVYLLAAILPSLSYLTDILIIENGWHFYFKYDALQHAWISSGDAKIIRLAGHLYTWQAATVDDDAPIKKQLEETKNYLPVELLLGLDHRLTDVAMEALRIFCEWNDIVDIN